MANATQRKASISTRHLRSLASGLDVLVAIAVGASYPLYVQFDALPRADEFGPPVPDRYPWALAFLLVSYLGYRCKTVAACLGASALLSLSAVLAHTDAAYVTGVAESPVALSAAAIAVVFAVHLLQRVLASQRAAL